MERKTWYFTASGTKLGDLYNILHVPYTAMVLAFVLMGAEVTPQVHAVRLAATLLAYLLALGIGAHALDQLEPEGSHYVLRLSRRELTSMAIVGLGGGIALGLYYAATVSVLLVPFIAAGVFFAVAYPLPSRVLGGAFHNNPSFAFAWGFLPAVTSYFANAATVALPAIAVGAVTAALAWEEIRLSRFARSARKQGLPATSYRRSETGLKLLVALTCSSALLLMAGRIV